MARLILVSGPCGAGKTTYSIELCQQLNAIRFSIDPWMQTLFSEDMSSLDFAWITERVQRCHLQIWDVAAQVLTIDANVVLDLGFTLKEQRQLFFDKAKQLGVSAELHYLHAPVEVRRVRVGRRNNTKDPNVYSFEVSEFMFNFMEQRFETPGSEELADACVVNTQ